MEARIRNLKDKLSQFNHSPMSLMFRYNHSHYHLNYFLDHALSCRDYDLFNDIESLFAHRDVLYIKKRFNEFCNLFFSSRSSISPAVNESSNKNTTFICEKVVNLYDNSVLYYELLYRFYDSSVFFLPQGVFQKADALFEFDVFLSAISFASTLPQEHFPVSVNLSTLSLSSSENIDRIIEISRTLSFDLSKLFIEITEYHSYDNTSDIILSIERLRVHGVRFCLDDFGSGFCNLDTALIFMPYIDCVKIDGFIFKESLRNELLSEVLRSYSAFFKSKGIDIIIEYIEDIDDCVRARDLASFGQGYYFDTNCFLEYKELK